MAVPMYAIPGPDEIAVGVGGKFHVIDRADEMPMVIDDGLKFVNSTREGSPLIVSVTGVIKRRDKRIGKRSRRKDMRK